MTCIAGLVHSDGIYIASDSQTTWGMTKHESGSKVFRKGEAVFAFTGLCAVPHAIEHRLEIPEVPEGDEIKWLHVKLPDAMRETLKEINLLGKESSMKAEAIIGWRNHLVTVDSVFGVMPALRDYVAAGSGGQVAIGSLYTSEGKRPRDRLELAVQAAQLWSVGVGGEVHIEKV